MIFFFAKNLAFETLPTVLPFPRTLYNDETWDKFWIHASNVFRGIGAGLDMCNLKKPPKCKFFLRLLSMTVPHTGREGYRVVGQLASQRTGSDIPSSLCSIYTLSTQIYNKAPPHPRSPLIYLALTSYTSSSLVALS